MTIEQMDAVIQKQCNGYCEECPIKEICDPIVGCFKSNPDELVKAYRILRPYDDVTLTQDDKVNHPSHYNQGGIECIDAMVSAFGKEAVGNFCICNAFKYVWRAKQKNGVEDLDKAIWYLNKVKELTADEAV